MPLQRKVVVLNQVFVMIPLTILNVLEIIILVVTLIKEHFCPMYLVTMLE